MPLVERSGLSAWIKQHSEASRWDFARLSGRPRNLRPDMGIVGAEGVEVEIG
jgi:hypothetical protein